MKWNVARYFIDQTDNDFGVRFSRLDVYYKGFYENILYCFHDSEQIQFSEKRVDESEKLRKRDGHKVNWCRCSVFNATLFNHYDVLPSQISQHGMDSCFEHLKEITQVCFSSCLSFFVIDSIHLGFSYFEFRIRITRLGITFQKQKFLYLNLQPTDSQPGVISITPKSQLLVGDTEKRSVSIG